MLNLKEKRVADVFGSSRLLVLIVDDEESICSTLSDVLEDESFSTITAQSGPEAITKLKKYRPALVFLDIWMPGLDGLWLLEKIKTMLPLTEVIMISGHSTIANALEASKRGAFDFIEKPLNIDDIVLSATRALERRERELKLQGEAVYSVDSSVALTAGQRSLPILTHRGVLSQGLPGRNRGQRTLKKSTILYGQGLHSGEKSGLVLEPLPLNSGIHFGKIGSSQTVPAFLDFVDSTNFATTVRLDRVSAGTIEHLMSALHAYEITNLLVKSNNEIPIFDGSAKKFCEVLEEAGIEEQGGQWHEIVMEHSETIKSGTSESSLEETITIEPADVLTVSYELDYPQPVGRQFYEFTLNCVDDFKREIAPARTFGFLKDVERLQRTGLAAGGRLDNFILIDQEKIVNTELRFEDELVRHKILDIVGDLFLFGRPLRAKVSARMTGHSDNAELLRKLRKNVL